MSKGYYKPSQFGTVDVAVPWALVQEQAAGFPSLEDVMLIWSNTMSLQPCDPQAKVIALSSPDVPSNPRNVTPLTSTPPTP